MYFFLGEACLVFTGDVLSTGSYQVVSVKKKKDKGNVTNLTTDEIW